MSFYKMGNALGHISRFSGHGIIRSASLWLIVNYCMKQNPTQCCFFIYMVFIDNTHTQTHPHTLTQTKNTPRTSTGWLLVGRYSVGMTSRINYRHPICYIYILILCFEQITWFSNISSVSYCGRSFWVRWYSYKFILISVSIRTPMFNYQHQTGQLFVILFNSIQWVYSNDEIKLFIMIIHHEFEKYI